ncbi:hypothetical protein ABL840_08990 [Variovorax sp. NFACC27]|uniref:hypothetical protein n=1 Tax=unclassified Variovorax TaxID=663243 RepID=UPI000897C87F|nr:hypothetical protein SAMN03159371_05296 [Variovorax sp. NFACC28]SEG89567.1 hypothetical protein SAMN03159365_05151 [Variovorax sp. NFACC29]SFD40808.1 hypothetical protein SAMN03159379_05186 [Variovorax sp. NFACC26]SFG42961.1 hypothetical protein SAMN03159447_03296 [Variovorax sp. NFACC27]
MKPLHTLGPWHLGAGLKVYDEGNNLVARCDSTRGKFEYEEPNAQLISAAPELLAALQAIYDECEGYVPNTAKSVWVAALHAISKAKGESS